MVSRTFHRKKLDNGVTVLFEQRDIPVIAVASSVRYGAQFETASEKGISHFIEHLVFKGTKNRSVVEIPKDIEGKGGVLNAFTSEEITCFWNKLPSKYFSLGADVSRDLILHPLFERHALERERKVILEEIKMYRDDPSTYVLEKIKELLYEKPFNMSIAGTHESVSTLSRDAVIALHKKICTANNIIFSAVGDADFNDIIAEAKKFPKTSYSVPPVHIIPRYSTLIEKRKGIDQAHAVVGFHRPMMRGIQRYASEIFDSILGGGMSSRLFQGLREKRGLCYAVKSNLEQSRDYAYELVYVGTIKEKIQTVKRIILGEIKKLNRLDIRELSEAKERLIGLTNISKEKCDATMMDLLHEELAGNAENYYRYEKYIGAVSLHDVRQLSKLSGYSFISLVPH